MGSVLLVALLVLGAAALYSYRWPSEQKTGRKIVDQEEYTIHRKARFTVVAVTKVRRMSLDWDGSEETREESLEDVYTVATKYGLVGEEQSMLDLMVGDGVEVSMSADVVLQTLGEA